MQVQKLLFKNEGRGYLLGNDTPLACTHNCLF